MEGKFLPDFFSENRKNLCEKLDKDSLILIPAGSETFRFAGMSYPFFPEPNFFYFSGIVEPNCFLLMMPYSAVGKHEILFIPKPLKNKEKWDGKTISKEQAKQISGIDEIEYTEDFFALFKKQQNWKNKLYIESNNFYSKSSLHSFLNFLKEIQTRHPALEIKKLDNYIALLRAKKNPLEIEAIQRAIEITKTALHKIWQKAPYAKTEKELEAELTYFYQILSADHAFSPIIASGKNATILHYTKNKAELQEKDLLLIDTGAFWQGYNSDITRVIPLAKKFSDKQKRYYELVLQIQSEVVASIKTNITWWDLYRIAGEIQGKILKKAGIIDNEKEQQKVTFHQIGHPLGLEVHDICNPDLLLEAGTVLTIEPGIYLPEEEIGIRIEDNFLITDDKIKNLSAGIPKTIEEIENIFNS